MDTAQTIVDRIVTAMDAQSLILVTAVFKAGEDHFAEHATEEGAVDYLNMLESLAIAANKELVGPVTASEIRSRIRADVALIEEGMSGLLDRARINETDFCEIRKVLGLFFDCDSRRLIKVDDTLYQAAVSQIAKNCRGLGEKP